VCHVICRKTLQAGLAKQVSCLNTMLPLQIFVWSANCAHLCYLTVLLQIATGKGALGQLQLELNLPSYAVDLLVLGILGYSLAGAFNPATYSEENQKDVKKRNPGVHHSVLATCLVPLQ